MANSVAIVTGASQGIGRDSAGVQAAGFYTIPRTALCAHSQGCLCRPPNYAVRTRFPPDLA